MLISALSSAWPQPALQRRAVEWLSLYWPDPDAGLINYDPSTEAAAKHRTDTAARRAKWDAVAAGLMPSLPLRCETDGDVSWFGFRALGVLSLLPRQPLVRAFVGWAVTRAIMGRPRHFDEVAWVLRWNPFDPTDAETALLAAVEDLLGIHDPISTDAAYWLLEALATPSAMARARQIRTPSPPTKYAFGTVEVDENTKKVRWDHDGALQASHDTPLHATMGLEALALDPAASLRPEDCAALDDLVSRAWPEAIWARTGWGPLNDARVLLARWAPHSLGNLLRRVFASASSRTGEAVRQLAWKVSSHLFILSDSERDALACAAARVASTSPPQSRDDRFAFLYLSVAQWADQPASKQVEILFAPPGGPHMDPKHRAALATPTADDFARLAACLSPELPAQQLAGWLCYLTLVPIQNMSQAYAPLVPLIGHPDKQVRQRALEVICQSGDQQLLDAVSRSGWRFVAGMDREEGAWGSIALCRAGGKEAVGDIRERIDPQALGKLAVVHCDDSRHLDSFAGFVKSKLDALLSTSEARVYPSYWSNFGEATDLLIKSRPQQTVDWLGLVHRLC